MEAEIARDVHGRPVPERFARRFAILQTLAMKGEVDSTWLRDSVGANDLELSELLTDMLRKGEVWHLTPAKGDSRIRPTQKGIESYMAIFESLYPSPESA